MYKTEERYADRQRNNQRKTGACTDGRRDRSCIPPYLPGARRVGKFAAACEAMGGARVEHGDAGYEFELLPGYRMQIMVYAGDDEFPPSSQVLYSDNFETGFSAEDRVVAGDILISSIKNYF